MATDAQELAYTEKAPLILGNDDGKSKARLVEAVGFGPGFRLGQVLWVTGEDVKQYIDGHVLVPVSDDATGVPPLQAPNTQRVDPINTDLGFRNQIGTDRIDPQALVGGDAAAYEPGGQTSIHDEQSDLRPQVGHVRTEDYVEGKDPERVTRTPRRPGRPARPAEATAKAADKGDD